MKKYTCNEVQLNVNTTDVHTTEESAEECGKISRYRLSCGPR